ncbi:cupin domain-containing protein [Neptuniibacter sp.]|uniref:cupin domain-containing protein n=1 Tax=Neptuniibacter sp. TaxID=1962643 RepID=UPI003B5974B3
MNTLPLGDISLEVFLRDYWQKKPLLIRNAFPDFVPPVSAEELAGLALEEEIESRLITQSDDGADWQLQHGPFEEEIFSTLPEKNWTLLVQSVDHWLPEAAEFVSQFNFIPSWRLDDLMISYAADGGGVGPHYDNYDVFLVQASGTRRWEVGGIYGEDSPRRPDTPVMILPEWQPEESWDLNPGDMLYLPPRVGHNGYGVGDDCMTYSIGFRAPSHQEIFEGLANQVTALSKAEDRYSDPGLKAQSNPGEITPAAIQQVTEILNSYLNHPGELAKWFGQLMTEPKNPEQNIDQNIEMTPDQIRDFLKNQVPISRTEGSRLAFHQRDGNMVLFYDGEVHNCSDPQHELAQQLCGELYLEQIEPTEENIKLLGILLKQGSIYFLDD